MTAPRQVPSEPEIRDLDEWEMVRRHLDAYDALVSSIMTLTGVPSECFGEAIDEYAIELATTEARHAADGMNAALRELGYRHGVVDARAALYDWGGRAERVA